MFVKYCLFSLKLWFFWTLSVLLQRWFSTCLVCVHKLSSRENRERPESGIFLKIRKKTPYVMNTLLCCLFDVHCYVIAFTSFLNNPGIRICLYIYTKYHVNNNGQHQSETRDFIVIRSGRPANAGHIAGLRPRDVENNLLIVIYKSILISLFTYVKYSMNEVK